MNAYYEANVGSEHSKSANAAQAESEGRFPMTVAAKKMGLTARAFRAGCSAAKYETDEWHHTGTHARRTFYFDMKVLSANADFWRGAAKCYGEKKAASILAAHNVSALTHEELLVLTVAARAEALENVQRFLKRFENSFVIQTNFFQTAEGEWRQQLRGNSAMADLGLLSGYDHREHGLKVYSMEAAEAELARRNAQPKDPFPTMQRRIVSVRDDLLTNCPLYGKVGGDFLTLGEAKDYLPSAQPDAGGAR